MRFLTVVALTWALALLVAGCAGDDASTALKCEYHGWSYDDGVQFPAVDGCNVCVCNESGDRPGEYECTQRSCDTCPDNFVEQFDCPNFCVQVEPAGAVPPFYCGTECAVDADCGNYKCDPDGYCVPPCSNDFDCQGTFGQFDRCDTTAGRCTFD